MLGLAVALAVSAAPLPPAAPAAAAVPSAALQALLEAAVARNHGDGGGIMRVVRLADGGTVWAGAAGRPHRSAPVATALSDAFEVASITKTFTAVLALQLCAEGRLGLDWPLRRLAPASLWHGLLVLGGRDVTGSITLRQLLQHTSGLPDYWSDPPEVDGALNAFERAFLADVNRFWEPRELLEYARALTPIGAPGRRWHYADTNYVLVGMILEQVTERPLRQLLRERLFAPLHMDATYMSYREGPPTAATLMHRYEDDLDLHDQWRQSADWASGGLVTTTADLGRFAVALAAGRVVPTAALRAAMRRWRRTGQGDNGYGLGLFHLRLPDGLGEMWGHDGHGNSFMFVWPQGGLALVGSLNQLGNDWWPMAQDAAALLRP